MDQQNNAEFRSELDDNCLGLLWELEDEEFGEERTDLEPAIWKWEDIVSAVDIVEEEFLYDDLPEGDRRYQRRDVVPMNPNYSAISHTIYVGIQRVSPGEVAPSHRHSGNALRFVVNGNEETKTVVEGEGFSMCDNDLITTPHWAWHGHTNESDEKSIWLDVLDLPLVLNSFNTENFFENYGEGGELQPMEKPPGYHNSKFGPVRTPGTPSLLGDFDGGVAPTPPYRFDWEECLETLHNADEFRPEVRDPADGITLEYINPVTGDGPLFPTFSVRLQKLRAGERMRAHRHSSTEFYHIIRGSGMTDVEGTSLEWDERDLFLVPPNKYHYHCAAENSIVVAFSDRPLFEKCNLYYKEELE